VKIGPRTVVSGGRGPMIVTGGAERRQWGCRRVLAPLVQRRRYRGRIGFVPSFF